MFENTTRHKIRRPAQSPKNIPYIIRCIYTCSKCTIPHSQNPLHDLDPGQINIPQRRLEAALIPQNRFVVAACPGYGRSMSLAVRMTMMRAKSTGPATVARSRASRVALSSCRGSCARCVNRCLGGYVVCPVGLRKSAVIQSGGFGEADDQRAQCSVDFGDFGPVNGLRVFIWSCAALGDIASAKICRYFAWVEFILQGDLDSITSESYRAESCRLQGLLQQCR